MKRHLNCNILNGQMGLEFGQECQANIQQLNKNAQSIYTVGSFISSAIRSLFKIITFGTLRTITLS